MILPCLIGMALPLLGTWLGAACVFFLPGKQKRDHTPILHGFAAGVMTAASIWSLLIPAMEQMASMGRLRFLPAVCGLLPGFLFLFVTDRLLPRTQQEQGTLLRYAVNLHNLPEGMAVGVVYAGLLAGVPGLHLSGALALSAGIAIQNIPEGAIVSLPLYNRGCKRLYAFGHGLLSGLVETGGTLLTLLFYHLLSSALPYLLGFAAGAMLCAVMHELAPDLNRKETPIRGILSFALGFTLMMILDVALG